MAQSILEMATRMSPSSVNFDAVARDTSGRGINGTDVSAAMASLDVMEQSYIYMFNGMEIPSADFHFGILHRMLAEPDHQLGKAAVNDLYDGIRAACVVDNGGGWCSACHGSGLQVTGEKCQHCGGDGVTFNQKEIARKLEISIDRWRSNKSLKRSFQSAQHVLLNIRQQAEQKLSKALAIQ